HLAARAVPEDRLHAARHALARDLLGCEVSVAQSEGVHDLLALVVVAADDADVGLVRAKAQALDEGARERLAGETPRRRGVRLARALLAEHLVERVAHGGAGRGTHDAGAAHADRGRAAGLGPRHAAERVVEDERLVVRRPLRRGAALAPRVPRR